MLLTTVLLSLAAFSSAAFAQTERYGGNQPEEQVRFGGARRSVLNQDEGLLPFTGLDLTLFVATGAAAIGTGIVVLRRTRPRENR
jgi:hypothetical protein